MSTFDINTKKYRTEIWMHKKSGKLAEVLINTWFGTVILTKEFAPNTMFRDMDEGDFYFDDMPESDPKFWEVIGIIEEPKEDAAHHGKIHSPV